MKSTGIVRRLDELGRITLPIELRRNFDVNERDPLEIFVDDDKIILKKYNPADIFTGEDMDDLIDYKGKKVSRKSIIELAKLAGFEITEDKGIRVARDEIPRAITAERLTHQIDAVGIHAEFLLQLADQTHQELGALRFLHACIIAAIRPVHIDPLVARGQLRNQHDALVLLVADERRDQRRKIFQLFLVIRAARTRAVEIDQNRIGLFLVIVRRDVHPVVQRTGAVGIGLLVKLVELCDRGQRLIRLLRCLAAHTRQRQAHRHQRLSIFGNE